MTPSGWNLGSGTFGDRDLAARRGWARQGWGQAGLGQAGPNDFATTINDKPVDPAIINMRKL
jgi:hypothetical protein